MTIMHGAGGALSLRLSRIAATWRDRARERHQLARLGDRELRDIGLNRCDIAAEVGKPFWRA